MVAAYRLRNLGQIADPVRRNDGGESRRNPGGHRFQGALGHRESGRGEHIPQVLEQRGDPVVVEPGGTRTEHRHRVPGHPECLPVADELAGDIAARVDGDDVGVVEHVDLLELGRRTELRGHHVERDVGDGHDGGVTLADAGRLDDDEVVAGRFGQRDHVGQVRRQLAGAASAHGAEEHPPGFEAVHPDPVAEQRAAAPAAGGVDRDDGDAQLVVLVMAETADQLVGER